MNAHNSNDIINYEISIFFSQGAFLHHPLLLVYLTGGDDDVDQSVSLLLCYFWVLTERDFMLLTTLDHRGLAMNENEWILEAPKSRPHRPNLIVAFWIRAQCAIWPQIVSKCYFLEILGHRTHYSKSQIFVQKFNIDKTPTFSRVFHPNFFWQFFSWNQSCQQLKCPKPQFFHEFSPKKSTIFSGNQSWIFGQKMKISNSVVIHSESEWISRAKLDVKLTSLESEIPSVRSVIPSSSD